MIRDLAEWLRLVWGRHEATVQTLGMLLPGAGFWRLDPCPQEALRVWVGEGLYPTLSKILGVLVSSAPDPYYHEQTALTPTARWRARSHSILPDPLHFEG